MARKKILSLWLALVLICGLTTPAFAAGKMVQIPTNGYNSNLDGVSVTLSNVLAVKTVPVTFCHPGEWISDTEFYLEFEERPITVYCISRSGSVLTVKDKEEREALVFDAPGCVLEEDGYEGDRGVETDELQSRSVGPNTRAFDLTMGSTYVETDIHSIGVETMNVYYTYCDLSKYPDGEMIEAMPEAKQDEGQVTADGIRVLFEHQRFDFDDAAAYTITFTNTNDHPIQGSYGLITYLPYKLTEATIAQQIMFYDLTLSPGESVTKSQGFQWHISPRTEMLWVQFDNPQEKELFIEDSPLSKANANCYTVYNAEDAETFYQDKFGLTFQPATDLIVPTVTED